MAIYGCKKTDNNTATSSSITVSGTVIDAVTQLPIPYVSMELITQSNFATYQGDGGKTDSLGRFSFLSSAGTNISFSKTGYIGQTWTAQYGGAPIWNIKLQPMKKISITGSITDINNNPIDSVKINLGYNYAGQGGGGILYLFSKRWQF